MSQPPVPPGQLPLFDLRGRRVLVLGLGESGLAMARWALRQEAAVAVADTRAEPPAAARLRERHPGIVVHSGGFDASWLDGVDLVAWSPGLSIESGPSAEFHRLACSRGVAVAGELELFAQALAALSEGGYRPGVVAITGTNGKTTVTAMAAHLAESAGVAVRAAGNIGPAMLDALADALDANDLPDLWVLELSSFQLALADHFHADASVILNVTQDHLDWHASMESYLAAKRRIHVPGAKIVRNRADPATWPRSGASAASFGPDVPAEVGDLGVVVDGGLAWLAEAIAAEEPSGRRRQRPVEVAVRRLMPADALRVRGAHNQQNALAALALCRAVGVPMARMLHGLRDYAGEPHRCQLIASIDGVEYYDDSKGTNVGATVAAIEGLGRRCWLIAGGQGKGQDFGPLVAPVRQHACGVILIGVDAPRLADALAPAGVARELAASLADAVALAAGRARAGEAVLLSPACASLDMFRHYGHRAAVFRDAVAQRAAARGLVLELPC